MINFKKQARKIIFIGRNRNDVLVDIESFGRECYTAGQVDAKHKALITLAGLILSNGGKLGIHDDVTTTLDYNFMINKWKDNACNCEWYEVIRKQARGK
jgi:hypothetical protein